MADEHLCKSCSGPLDEFKPEEIIKEGFCPYCVDVQGNLKSYGDILDGMLAYIEADHPEISEEEKLPTAKKWLREGEVWGQVFSGVIIEESLEDKGILDKCKIISTKVAHDDNPETNAGEPKWTLHTVEVSRADVEEIVEFLKQNLKLPNWWADLGFEDEVYIVFRGKVFSGNKTDKEFVDAVVSYGNSVKLPASQLPLQ